MFVYISVFDYIFFISGLTVQCEAIIILTKGLADTCSQFPMREALFLGLYVYIQIKRIYDY